MKNIPGSEIRIKYGTSKHCFLLKTTIVFIILFCSRAMVWMQGFPDISLARVKTKTLLESGFSQIKTWPTQIVVLPGIADVAVGVDVTGDNAVVYYALQENAKYSDFYPGSSAVFKKKTNNEIIKLRIRYNYDPDSWIEILPAGKKSQINVYLFGTVLFSNVILPVSMEDAVYLPFQRIKELGSYQIDWKSILLPQYVSAYAPLEKMSILVRNVLPLLKDSDDGAFDESGTPVFIESLSDQDTGPGLNCSGFAKWIVDGLLTASGKKALSIQALKTKHEDYRGNRMTDVFEDARDPYFGLDWTRNLAMMYAGYTPQQESMYEYFDLRFIAPLEYQEDIGYNIETLRSLAYLSAINNPGQILLLSINRPVGKKPVLQQHHHIAVLIPYFDNTGRFFSVLFERNVETDLGTFIKRYPGGFFHPVLLRVKGGFTPFGIDGQ